MHSLNTLIVLTITNFISVIAFGAPSQDKAGVKLRSIAPNQFCNSIQAILSGYAKQNGSSPRDSLKFGSVASQKILQQVKATNLDEYYDVTVTTLQNPQVGSVSPENRRWLNTPDILTQSLGITPKRVLLVNSLDELKMVAHVAPESQLLVLASSLGPLNPDRARDVADAAQFGKIQINIIWVGKESAAINRAAVDALMFLASSTGGSFVDLSSASACSGV